MKISFLLLWLLSFNAYAADYFALLDVRYATGIKKTFIGGPYSSKAQCNKLNQVVWDNVQPTCGNCKNEMQVCSDMSVLNEPLRKVLAGEKTALTYVNATEKGKIILSAASASVIAQECEDSAKKFRLNGYKKASCVHSILIEDAIDEAWMREIASFIKHIKALEGIDYDASPVLFQALNTEVKRLAHLPENEQKKGIWFLSEAHKNIKQRLSKK